MRKDNVSVKNVKTINTQTGEVKQRRVETTTLDERPSIWNLQAFAIVFLFIMLATTINVYSANNDNLTWIDNNGDFKNNSYNHSMINLDTDLVELNNQSLNDVFLDGNLIENHDFSNGTNDWSMHFGVGTFSILDNQAIVSRTSANNTGYFVNSPTKTFIFNDKYYINVKVSSNDTQMIRIFTPSADVFNSSSLYTNISSTLNNYSWLYNVVNQTNSLFGFSTFHQSFVIGNYTVIYESPYLINLTNLGIDNLTKDEIDEYYDLYVSLQENRVEAYKELGNEPIAQYQNLYQILETSIDAILGPIDNIGDWINKFMQGMLDLIERR